MKMVNVLKIVEDHPVLSAPFVVFFLGIALVFWSFVAICEQIYMKFLGFEWDRHYWGYVNPETGERKRDNPW